MAAWKQIKLLPREFWVLCLGIFINRAGTMAVPFLVLFLTREKGVSPALASLAMSSYGIGSMICAPIAGRLADKFSPRYIMIITLVLSAGWMFVLPSMHSYSLLLGAVFCWAFMGEAFRPASMTVITTLVPSAHHKLAFAICRLAVNLGMSIGPAVGGWLATFSYPSIFYVDGVTSLFAAVVMALSPWRIAAEAATDKQPNAINPAIGGDHPNGRSMRKLCWFLFALFPTNLIFFQHDSTLPIYMVEHLGLTERDYGLIFVVNTFLIILLEVPLNLAMHNWPNRWSIPLSTILVGIGFGSLAIASNLLPILLTVIPWTFGEMIMMPAGTAYVASIAPADKRGSFMGWYLMSFSTAFAFGPWLGTVIMQHFGWMTLWCSCLVAGFVTAFLLRKID